MYTMSVEYFDYLCLINSGYLNLNNYSVVVAVVANIVVAAAVAIAVADFAFVVAVVVNAAEEY